MAKISLSPTLELAYPIYLDVPMMTSFAAAIEDGIAFESAVRLTNTEQKESGKEAQARAGVPYMSILSSLFSLDLQGKIHGTKGSGSEEEIQIARRHTEASLFMQLRQTMAQRSLIQNIIEGSAEKAIKSIEHGSLLEVSGQIYRSPLSETLEAVFRVFNMLGMDLSESPQRQDGNQQKRKSQVKGRNKQTNTDNTAFQLGGESLLGLQIAQRIKEDLEQAKVMDSILYPSNSEDLTVVVSLSTDALSEGTLDNLLSGRFTVLGKVTRIVQGEEEISLYQRSALSYLIKGRSDLDDALMALGRDSGFALSENPSSIKAPALQLMPLAIYC